MKIGHGYDVHRLVEGRRLVLGGITIPYSQGLEGHSDADVLTHAVMDALLGAMGMGDIGRWFSDQDENYRNIDSLDLLRQVKEWMDERGYTVGNIDATIVAQQPKLAPYLPLMQEKLEQVLESHNINVKATTEERLGFTGREEGMAAHAVCLLMEQL